MEQITQYNNFNSPWINGVSLSIDLQSLINLLTRSILLCSFRDILIVKLVNIDIKNIKYYITSSKRYLFGAPDREITEDLKPAMIQLIGEKAGSPKAMVQQFGENDRYREQ